MIDSQLPVLYSVFSCSMQNLLHWKSWFYTVLFHFLKFRGRFQYWQSVLIFKLFNTTMGLVSAIEHATTVSGQWFYFSCTSIRHAFHDYCMADMEVKNTYIMA